MPSTFVLSCTGGRLVKVLSQLWRVAWGHHPQSLISLSVSIATLTPFFNALGWDIDNTAGYAQAYKDVVHEDAIKVGGLTKAPDYCFLVCSGGIAYRPYARRANSSITC